MKRNVPVLLLLASTLFLAAPALAKPKAPTEPGRYTEWAEEIDEIAILQRFDLGDYQTIVVTDLDGSQAELPEQADNSYPAAKEIAGNATAPFVEGLREALSGGPRIETGPDPGRAAGTLVVRGEVLTIDPGSRAARYWAGFGAGAARVQVRIEYVDAASGKVLVRFTQERRSGVGVGGGSYDKLLARNLRKIGEDAALVFTQFR